MKAENVNHARYLLERIQAAASRGDPAMASLLEKQLWENALEMAAMHVCGTSPSDLCATALTSRKIAFKRGFSP